MLKYMLDTNIVIYVLKNRPPSALESFNRYEKKICISSITLAELMHGVEKSTQRQHNLHQVNAFVSRVSVLAYGSKAASHYGSIRAELERQGTPIGVNDLHIAGHAQSERLVLVTNNLAEFKRIRGLTLDNWV